MPLPLTPDEIKKYYYWREFLLRSKKYKILCEIVRSKRPHNPLPVEIEHSWCPLNEKHHSLYYDWIDRAFSWDELRSPFSRAQNLTNLDVLECIYPLFQDAFCEPFVKVEHKIKLFHEQYDPNIVVQCVNRIIGDRNFESIKKFLMITEFNPHDRIKPYYHEYLHSIITNEQGLFMLTPTLWPYFTIGNKKFSQWEAYIAVLDALDTTSGNTPEAFRELYPKMENDEGAASNSPRWPTFQKQAQKAMILLRNAEMGTFPGKHTETTKGNKNN